MELKTNIDSGDVKISRNADGTETKIEATPKEEDLITRVTKEEVKEPEVDKPTEHIVEPEFDFKEVEQIKDHEAKAWAEKAYKSFQKGFNQKFQEIAELRKSLESQVKPDTPNSWTPERLQSEMNKSDFVQSAQQVIKLQNPDSSGLTDEEYSSLSNGEKTKLQTMEKEIVALKQQSSLAQMRVEDEKLKNKYANYDSQAIDILTSDMISGKVQATREYLYKAMMHDENVKRAYSLGLQDKNLVNQEKITSMSAEGVNATGDDNVPEPEKGETDRNYFLRLAARRQKQHADGQMKK